MSEGRISDEALMSILTGDLRDARAEIATLKARNANLEAIVEVANNEVREHVVESDRLRRLAEERRVALKAVTEAIRGANHGGVPQDVADDVLEALARLAHKEPMP